MMDIFEKPMPMVNHKGELMEGNTGDPRKKLFEEVVPITPNLQYLFLTKRPSNINKYIPESWKGNPPSNVMFGTSPVNQETANKLIPQLLQVKGKTFLSIEPMLGPIILEEGWLKDISQVIVGGESGHGRRPFNLDWARSIRDQCKASGVPFFFKQIDKVYEKEHGIPLDLQIREFPKF